MTAAGCAWRSKEREEAGGTARAGFGSICARAGLIVGHRAAGIGSLWRGEPVEARRHLEQTLALYDPEQHRSLAALYAYDPWLAGLAGLAFVLFQLGYPDQAVARCREAVDDAERLLHPAGLAYALYHACMQLIRGTRLIS